MLVLWGEFAVWGCAGAGKQGVVGANGPLEKLPLPRFQTRRCFRQRLERHRFGNKNYLIGPPGNA